MEGKFVVLFIDIAPSIGKKDTSLKAHPRRLPPLDKHLKYVKIIQYGTQ